MNQRDSTYVVNAGHKVGRVGLEEEPLEWHVLDELEHVLGRVARARNERRDAHAQVGEVIQVLARHWPATREAVQMHAMHWIEARAHHLEHLGLGVAAVDHQRHAGLVGDVQLAFERLYLRA